LGFKIIGDFLREKNPNLRRLRRRKYQE